MTLEADIWNFDETGWRVGIGREQQAVFVRGQKLGFRPSYGTRVDRFRGSNDWCTHSICLLMLGLASTAFWLGVVVYAGKLACVG